MSLDLTRFTVCATSTSGRFVVVRGIPRPWVDPNVRPRFRVASVWDELRGRHIASLNQSRKTVRSKWAGVEARGEVVFGGPRAEAAAAMAELSALIMGFDFDSEVTP